MMVSWVNQYSADMCGVSVGGGGTATFPTAFTKITRTASFVHLLQ